MPGGGLANGDGLLARAMAECQHAARWTKPGQSIRLIERIGSLTALNRAYLDETKMYTGKELADEIQTKMNDASIGGPG